MYAYFRKVDDGTLSSAITDSSEFATKVAATFNPGDGSAPKPQYEQVGRSAYVRLGGTLTSGLVGPTGPTGARGATGPTGP